MLTIQSKLTEFTDTGPVYPAINYNIFLLCVLFTKYHCIAKVLWDQRIVLYREVKCIVYPLSKVPKKILNKCFDQYSQTKLKLYQ